MISRRKALLQTAAHAALFGAAAAFVIVERAAAAQNVGSAKDVVNKAWGTPPD